MRQFLHLRRYWIAAVIALAMLALSGVAPWSPLNCWHQDVNIHTGQIRHIRMLAFVPIRTRVEETWLSRALGRTEGRSDWRRVNTFSPGIRYSPHYQFHDAISQIEALRILDDVTPFTDADRSRIAATLISKWQTGSDLDAEKYVQELAESRLAAAR